MERKPASYVSMFDDFGCRISCMFTYMKPISLTANLGIAQKQNPYRTQVLGNKPLELGLPHGIHVCIHVYVRVIIRFM